MERVALEDVERADPDDAGPRQSLTGPLGAVDVAINHYRLGPGDPTSGLHAHLDQEEVFLVVDGEAAFETLDGTVAVGPGGAVRFAPGEFDSGPVPGGGRVETLAIGSPRDSDEIRIPLPCPECGKDARRPGIGDDGATPVLVCPACGTESDAACPACGGPDMRAELADDGQPVGVCRDCETETDA